MKLSILFASLLFVCPGALGGPLTSFRLHGPKDNGQNYPGGSIAAVPDPDDAVKSSVSKNRGTDVRQLVDRHQRDGVLPSLVERDSSVATGNSNDPTTTPSDKPIYEKPWFDGVIAAVGFTIIMTVVVVIATVIACCCYIKCKRKVFRTEVARRVLEFEDSTEWTSNSREASLQRHRVQRPKRQLGDSDEDSAVQFFLTSNPQSYNFDEKLDDLGSRVQKNWYVVKSVDQEDFMILTVAPVSGSCPLQLHKHQKGLNKLLGAVKLHPFIHPVERVEYLTDYQLLVMVQPQRYDGSLKDMIYRVSHPTLDWSQKYGRRSRGLSPAKVARYGRHVLEAMMFLYSKNFPTLDHVQSGNIFVVDDVCLLGGYENTLLGYKTRLYMKCKDHMDQLDVILFGHLLFEMAAGYELTQLRPGMGEIKTVPKAVRPILEFIFEEGFPHTISKIIAHDFFDIPLPEMKDFNPAAVQLTDSMKKVLEKVRKSKPRVQKAPKHRPKQTPSVFTGGRGNGDHGELATSGSWKDKVPHMPKQIQQFFGQRKGEKPSDTGLLVNDNTEPLIVKGKSY